MYKSLRKTWFFPSEEKPLPILTALSSSFNQGTMPVLQGGVLRKRDKKIKN